MSDISVAPVSTSTTTPPAKVEQATVTAPEYVSKNDFDAGMQRIQNLSAIVGGLTNELKSLRKADPVTPAPQGDGKQPTLTETHQQLQALQSTLTVEKKHNAIEAAVAKRVGDDTEYLRKYVMAVYGDKVKVTTAGAVVFEEAAGVQTPIGKWADAFLATREGERFLPPKAAASSDGLRGGAGGVKADHPFKALAFDKLMEKQGSQPGQFTEYREQHPDDFGQKRKAFYAQ